MKTKIIKIGNSQGILLPKPLISQYLFENEVEVFPVQEGIFIKPVNVKPRHNWNKMFEEAILKNEQPQGELLEGFANKSDKNEWTW